MIVFKFLAWFFVNIGIPVFAPIALLPLLGVGKSFRELTNGIVRKAIQDGQLFWTVIAMCAGACYEIAPFIKEATDGQLIIAWVGLIWHILVIIASAVLVLLGTVDALAEQGGSVNVHDPKIMIVSLWMTGITAVSFSATHVLAG